MKKSERFIGFISIITAAIIFGLTPILSKITYIEGSNPSMLVFLRSCISIPVLLVILKAKKISFKISNKNLLNIFLYSIFTSTITAFLLYSSYSYIPVGIATTVHYVYPMLVAVILAVFFKEKISKLKLVTLIVSFIGISLFFDGDITSINKTGIIIAFTSGLSYGISLIIMDKSEIKTLYPFLVTFYCCLFSSICMIIILLTTDTFTLQLSTKAWFYSFIISLTVSTIAITLLQVGIKRIGPTTTAILLMFEPISSITIGTIALNENCTFKTIVGCSLILISVLFYTIFDKRIKNELSSS